MKTRLQVKVMAASLLAVGATVVLWACQKEKYPDDAIDAQIAKSVEMENYIVAGYELQTALVEFQKELNKVDFSKLEFVPNAEGIMSLQLPIQSLVFEAKLNTLNNQKRELHRKFPQLVSFTSERRESIIESCLTNSVVVNTKLLNMGINVMLPSTKGYYPEPWLEGMEFLGGWTAGSNYVEAHAIFFMDGNCVITVDPRNTRDSSHITVHRKTDGQWYHESSDSPIYILGHTHQTGWIPSQQDMDNCRKTPGLRRGIYFNGELREYNENGILW